MGEGMELDTTHLLKHETSWAESIPYYYYKKRPSIPSKGSITIPENYPPSMVEGRQTLNRYRTPQAGVKARSKQTMMIPLQGSGDQRQV